MTCQEKLNKIINLGIPMKTIGVYAGISYKAIQRIVYGANPPAGTEEKINQGIYQLVKDINLIMK